MKSSTYIIIGIAVLVVLFFAYKYYQTQQINTAVNLAAKSNALTLQTAQDLNMTVLQDLGLI